MKEGEAWMPNPVYNKPAQSRAILPVLGGISGSTSTICSGGFMRVSGFNKKGRDDPAF